MTSITDLTPAELALVPTPAMILKGQIKQIERLRSDAARLNSSADSLATKLKTAITAPDTAAKLGDQAEALLAAVAAL